MVSIVVPIYNVQEYLEKCVGSILAQTYTDYELILVDDGSKDASAGMCDLFARQDSRIRVIHKKNGGLSDARNAGLREARGEYICFIDGDDYIDESYLSCLVRLVRDYEADIAVCGFRRVEPDADTKNVDTTDIQTEELTGIDAMRDVIKRPTKCDVVAWNKLYKTDLFRSHTIEYPVGKLHEDMFTTYKVMYFAHKVVYTPLPLYNYVQRSASIMGGGFNSRSIDAVEAGKEMYDWVQKMDSPSAPLALGNFSNSLLNTAHKMTSANAVDQKISATIQRYVRMYLPGILTSRHIVLPRKLLCVCIACNFRVYASIKQLAAVAISRKNNA